MSNTFKLIISIALPLVIGFTASLLTTPEIQGWFAGIQKPTWNPPNWIFAPVWTLLYILMGIAFYLVWKTKADLAAQQKAIGIYLVQLVLNFCWSFIFFNQHEIRFAFMEIVLLWLMILVTIFAFGKVHKTAAWLMVPYISWVSFAAMLNYSIWQLNK